jgi:hypothetical protein
MRKSSDGGDDSSSSKSITISSSPQRANNDLQQQRPSPFRRSPFLHSMFLPAEVHRSLTSSPRALTGCRCAVTRGLVLTS